MNGRKIIFVLLICIGIGILALFLIINLSRQLGIKYSHLFLLSVTALLFAFFIILLVRYLVITFFSFLSHFQYREELPQDEHLKKVSILVPVYNEEKILETVITTLLSLNYPKNKYELILVDDGSTDQSFMIAHQMLTAQRLVKTKIVRQANFGKAAALNNAFSLSEGEIILCIDSDCVLTPDTLLYGIRHFTNPEIGAVAGNVKVWNQDKLFTKLQALEYLEGLNFARRAQGYFRAINIVPGAIGFFKRSVLEEVGLYNGATYAEDCDLTLRILQAGYKIVYEPKAIAYTEVPEKIDCLLKQRYRWTRGILQSIVKNRILLFNPKLGLPTILSYSLLVYEAIIWPAANIIAHLLFSILALIYGVIPFLIGWWGLLTLLDFSTACYARSCETREENHTYNNRRISFFHIPLLVLGYRLYYILMIDMTKIFSLLEQILNLNISWQRVKIAGKLNSFKKYFNYEPERVESV